MHDVGVWASMWSSARDSISCTFAKVNFISSALLRALVLCRELTLRIHSGRGNSCETCKKANEAHLGRHKDIAEILDGIYSAAGTTFRAVLVPGSEDVHVHASESPGYRRSGSHPRATKKERKERKRRVRIAARKKKLTTADYDIIAEILHGNPENPSFFKWKSNPLTSSDVQTIVTLLKACVQNQLKKRPDACSIACRLIDTSTTDFVAEMGRILASLEIDQIAVKATQLGIGKAVTSSVEDLKTKIGEDIIKHKTEEAETRLRQGGFERYCTKSAGIRLADVHVSARIVLVIREPSD